jgi:hypothetical protein
MSSLLQEKVRDGALEVASDLSVNAAQATSSRGTKVW